MEKLRKERSQYLKWSSNSEEIERLARFCIAYEYVEAQKMAQQSDETMKKLKQDVTDIESNIKQYETESSQKEQEIKHLETEKEDSMSAEFTEAANKEEKASKDLVKARTTWENKKRALEDERKTYQRQEQQRKYLLRLPIVCNRLLKVANFICSERKSRKR